MPDHDPPADPPASRYDLLLGLVPVTLAAGLGWAWLTPAPTVHGVVAGGLASALIVGYGLFCRTPVDDGDGGPGS